MFDNLAVTFYNNVVAAYDEYVAHRDLPEAGRDKHLRTAVAAATALYHFREHLPASLSAALAGCCNHARPQSLGHAAQGRWRVRLERPT